VLYIHSISSVSVQNTFEQEGFCLSLVKCNEATELLLPNYKEWLAPNSLRRMSPILKNSMVAALSCVKQIEEKPLLGIIVGTSLGCLTDTETFLKNISFSTSETLSPTSFIQSTHNTIAGQISLQLQNHGYNMTHSQNALSFETALIDANLNLEKEGDMILVGAAEEKIQFLDEISETWLAKQKIQSGTTFMTLSKEKSVLGIAISNVKTYQGKFDANQKIEEYLNEQGLSINEIDLIFYSGLNHSLAGLFSNTLIFSYLEYTGYYLTASALALHLAYDQLVTDASLRQILIINDICPNSIGLMYLKKYEA
jgi:3-oxoacyl-[acyl-carrier-protein] synthase II